MTPPSDESQRQRAFAAAMRLQESIQDLRADIHTLRTYGHRNRRLIWGLAVSLLLDVTLSVVVAVVAVQASEANSLANQNQRAQIQTCEASNQARAIGAQLWTYVLNAASNNPENQTPQRKKQIADFRNYMNSAYAQRDCNKPGT